LFENFIVVEAIKYYQNQGSSSPVYFYRDAQGLEVDLLVPQGGALHAIEIKAGATVQPDYFLGLKRFAAIYPNKLASGSVIYGGNQAQARSDYPVFSWERFKLPPPGKFGQPAWRG
jgi:uncharacterized protein